MKIQQKVKLQWTPRIQMSKGKISVKPSVYFISWSKRPWPVLTTHTQIWLNQLLAFLNLYRQAKNQFIPSVHLWDTVSFKVQWPDWLHPFLPILTQIIFDKLLFFVNLSKHVKNKFIPSVHSSDTVDFRVQSPDQIVFKPTKI